MSTVNTTVFRSHAEPSRARRALRAAQEAEQAAAMDEAERAARPALIEPPPIDSAQNARERTRLIRAHRVYEVERYAREFEAATLSTANTPSASQTAAAVTPDADPSEVSAAPPVADGAVMGQSAAQQQPRRHQQQHQHNRR